MSLNCGIVGLPNVGKSTIFSALTAAPAEAANYPFCTIDPNIGIVEVPDGRLEKINSIIEADKSVPAAMEFVDIAGLVKGASKGEGLGNKFLANIREVGMIVHVVRCFENEDITHVSNKIDPEGDIETINIELALADLATVEKRITSNNRLTRSGDKSIRDKANKMEPLLEKIWAELERGIGVKSMGLTEDEQEMINDLQLITMKKQVFVCNVDEDGIINEPDFVKKVREIAHKENAEVISLCGKLESEIAVLDDPEEREVFLEEAGLKESGLSKMVKTAYKALGLRTFFTAGGIENKAWTFVDGMTAPQAAGIIHTDFEKGFIKADVYSCEDLFEAGSEQGVKRSGKIRVEGKDYIMHDGDIVHFKFNV